DFWKKTPDQLWSERIRQACNMCGFCGEYLCWGGAREVPGQTLIPGEPKSGAHATVIQELRDMGQQPGSKVRVLCAARASDITLNSVPRATPPPSAPTSSRTKTGAGSRAAPSPARRKRIHWRTPLESWPAAASATRSARA